MASPPTRTLRATGPVIIVILIIAAALIGYFQIVYYPTVAPTSTTEAIVPPTKVNVTVIIPSGALSVGKPTSFYYMPDSITVVAGVNSTVIWRNNDSTVHTVTATPNAPDPRFNNFGPTNPSSWNNIQPNAEVNFTFTTPGTYNYTCSYHNWMHGQVVVLAGSGSSNDSFSASSSSSVASSSSAAILPKFHPFWSGAIAFASNLATRIGSGLLPWRVNLSRSLFAFVSLIPELLTKAA